MKKVEIVGIWETVLGAEILETVQVVHGDLGNGSGCGDLGNSQFMGIWETVQGAGI